MLPLLIKNGMNVWAPTVTNMMKPIHCIKNIVPLYMISAGILMRNTAEMNVPTALIEVGTIPTEEKQYYRVVKIYGRGECHKICHHFSSQLWRRNKTSWLFYILLLTNPGVYKFTRDWMDSHWKNGILVWNNCEKMPKVRIGMFCTL